MPHPSYIALHQSGELEKRIRLVEKQSESCTLCPHLCREDRTHGEKGFCRTGMLPKVASFSPHHGEESVLAGKNGSGTIFFSACNLKCVYCQNYDISQLDYGDEVSFEELAGIMLSLQRKGCHNINFVSPSHVVLPVLKALSIAADQGLAIPLVYNSGGYDTVATLQLLEGIFDIYMPDLKYMNVETAYKLSGIKDYPHTAQQAVIEMYRQAGDLKTRRGIACRGVMVRHLVLPAGLSEAKKAIDFIASVSTGIYLNIMDQYHPAYNARQFEGLSGRISAGKMDELIRYARQKGIRQLDYQGKVNRFYL